MNDNNLPLIVSPEKLKAYLDHNTDNKNLRIVDLSEQANYLQSHIPGALFLPYQSLVAGTAPAPGKLPSKAQLQEVFQYLGLNKDTHFLVYDDEGGGWAGRFIWTLDIIGHQKVSYLDGGIHAWRLASLPCASGQEENIVRLPFPPDIEIDSHKLISAEKLMNLIEESKVDIWDARSPEEFHGLRGNAAKLGHMPGAKNIEWTALMDIENGYRIRQDAKDFLKESGISGGTPIVTHCQTHHRSGFTYLVGKYLGLDIRAYDGSWAEWGNHPDTPVER